MGSAVLMLMSMVVLPKPWRMNRSMLSFMFCMYWATCWLLAVISKVVGVIILSGMARMRMAMAVRSWGMLAM